MYLDTCIYVRRQHAKQEVSGRSKHCRLKGTNDTGLIERSDLFTMLAIQRMVIWLQTENT